MIQTDGTGSKKGQHRRLEQFKEIRRTAGIPADHADELRQ